jgi:hypothetical protein
MIGNENFKFFLCVDKTIGINPTTWDDFLKNDETTCQDNVANYDWLQKVMN